MNQPEPRGVRTVEPTADHAQLDDLLVALRSRGLGDGSGPRLVGLDGAEVVIPNELFEVLVTAAHNLSQGRGVTIVPRETVMTTQQAAEFLSVSRPTLVKMLEAGEITYRRVGRHRRVALADLVAYQERQAETRAAALEEMAEIALAEGLYDLEATDLPESR